MRDERKQFMGSPTSSTGVVNSTRNSLEHWSKQILHVWATNHDVARQLARAYSRMPRDLTTNTVVLVTVVTTDADRATIFG